MQPFPEKVAAPGAGRLSVTTLALGCPVSLTCMRTRSGRQSGCGRDGHQHTSRPSRPRRSTDPVPCPGPVPPFMGAPPSPEGCLPSRRRHRTGGAAPAAAHLPSFPRAAETSSGATSHMGIAFPRVATRLAFAAAAVLAVAACDDADAPSTPPAEQSAPAPAPSAPAPASPSAPADQSGAPTAPNTPAPTSPTSPTTPAQPAPDAPGDAGSGATSPGAGDTGSAGNSGSGSSNLEPQSGTPSGNPAGGGT